MTFQHSSSIGSSSATAAESDREIRQASSQNHYSDSKLLGALQILLAVTLASLFVAVFGHLGFSLQSKAEPCAGPGYSLCSVWEDVRSFRSFAVGAVLCCVLNGGVDRGVAASATAALGIVDEDSRAADADDGSCAHQKVQFYACVL